jgi:signal transduction histidine kinase
MTIPRRRARWQTRLRRPRTARLRLTAVYGGLFLVSGAALVAVTYALFERVTKYRSLSLPRIPRTPAIHNLKSPSSLFQALPQLGKVQFLLTQDQRQLAKGFSIPVAKGGTPPDFPTSLLTQDQHQLTRDQRQLTEAVHRLALAVHQMAQGRAVEAAQRATDAHQLLVDAGIALAIVAVIALLAGWLIAGRVLRPIRTITRTARRISSVSLHERLALQGPEDELKELGDTLDDLFGRLDSAFEAQRHFVANASHELRTPLTADRNLLQVALDDPDTSVDAWRSTAEELLASNDEQRDLIESLLTLASSESGLDQREPVDLALVAQLVLDGRERSEHVGIRVESTLTAAPVDGDPRLLESLMANLVDNAVTHNVEGGRVDVSTGTREGMARVAVSNTGPLVPLADVDRLFEPFQRLDPRRVHHKNGHGIGLSIVRAIAAAHGATLAANPLPDGGLFVEVLFPAAVPVSASACAPMLTLAT